MTWTSLLDRGVYGVVMAVRAFVGVMPDAVGRGLGTLIGLGALILDGRHRRLAMDQVQAAFPRRSRAECKAITRATFVHFGRLLVAVLRFSTLSREGIRARVEYEGEDRVRAALAGGKGAFIYTGHFGFWELQGVAHALVLPPLFVTARPLDSPWLHSLLERMRTATGNHMIYKEGAVRRALAALRANGCVAILIDQHVQTEGAVTVEFFNRPATTTATMASLALRTGAPIIPAFALPLSGGRYRMVYEHPVEFPAADATDPVQELTQRCTDVLEMYVRRHPQLWFWMHRRWRDGVAGEDR